LGTLIAHAVTPAEARFLRTWRFNARIALFPTVDTRARGRSLLTGRLAGNSDHWSLTIWPALRRSPTPPLSPRPAETRCRLRRNPQIAITACNALTFLLFRCEAPQSLWHGFRLRFMLSAPARNLPTPPRSRLLIGPLRRIGSRRSADMQSRRDLPRLGSFQELLNRKVVKDHHLCGSDCGSEIEAVFLPKTLNECFALVSSFQNQHAGFLNAGRHIRTNPLLPWILWISILKNVTNCAPSVLMFIVRVRIIAPPESKDSQDPDWAFTETSS